MILNHVSHSGVFTQQSVDQNPQSHFLNFSFSSRFIFHLLPSSTVPLIPYTVFLSHPCHTFMHADVNKVVVVEIQHMWRIPATHKNSQATTPSRTTGLSNISNVCYLSFTVCKYLSEIYLKNVYHTFLLHKMQINNTLFYPKSSSSKPVSCEGKSSAQCSLTHLGGGVWPGQSAN